MQTTYPPTYLVELMSPRTGELEDADLYARLDTAVEKAYLHCAPHKSRAEVSTEDRGEIDGVGFFDTEGNLLACITVYCMERDTEVPTILEIQTACAASAIEMQGQLNELLAA